MDLLQALGKDFDSVSESFDFTMTTLTHSIAAFKEAYDSGYSNSDLELLARSIAFELKQASRSTERLSHCLENAALGILKEIDDAA